MLSSVLLFLFLLFIYSFGVATSTQGADSGDIILSYYFAGVPHPPGYPLNTMLGWIFTRLPIGDNFAFRANYLSAFYTALALTILFNTVVKLVGNKILSLTGILVLAFTPLIWVYAHQAEVFQLNLVLTASSLFFLASWLKGSYKRKISKDSILAFLFLGLAVFHHQTSLLLLPLYIALLWVNKMLPLKKWKNNLVLFCAFILGILPYVFVPFAALRGTPLNWDTASNLEGFIRLITRADYGTFTATGDFIGFSMLARLVQVLWYFKVFLADFTWFGALFALSGALYLARINKALFLFLVSGALLTGPFFLFYASFPVTSSFLMGVSERFMFTSYVFTAILMVFGLKFIVNILLFFAKKIPVNKELIKLFVHLIFLLFPFALFLLNFEKADLSKANLASIISKDVMGGAKPPGIIFLGGDTVTMGSIYEYYVNKTNEKSVPVMSGRLVHASYRKEFMNLFPNLSYPEGFSTGQMSHSGAITGLIGMNSKNFPIFSLIKFPLDENQFEMVQEGILIRVYNKNQAPSNEEIRNKIVDNLSGTYFEKRQHQGGYLHFFEENVLETYASIYAANAEELNKRGYPSEARIYFEKALKIQPNMINSLLGMAVSFNKEKDCEKALVFASKAKELEPKQANIYETLSIVYGQCFNDKARAVEYLLKANEINSEKIDQSLENL